MKEQDKQIILIKLKEIDFSLNLIRKRLPESYEEFQKLDILVRDGIYKRVEFIIQNILDILAIITKYLGKIPSDDISLIEILKNSRIISDDLAEKLRALKAFRNFLVHRYGDMFEELAFSDIKNGLSDIDLIVCELKRIIENMDP